MTPEQQARETAFLESTRRMFTVVGNSLLEMLPTYRQDLQFIAGDQWPQSIVSARTGDTIHVVIPDRLK